jgi:hypothetical protein
MNMLSVVAQCTPFSDMNQSPRNMYQCQMGKQTMGSPMFAYSHRCDNKSYRILTPQMPLVRNAAQDTFRMDDYPMGTNAVVAVISYTGYDMEDAMIINKASYDRGFGHGHVYTYTIVDLDKSAPKGSRCLVSPRVSCLPARPPCYSSALPLSSRAPTCACRMQRRGHALKRNALFEDSSNSSRRPLPNPVPGAHGHGTRAR